MNPRAFDTAAVASPVLNVCAIPVISFKPKKVNALFFSLVFFFLFPKGLCRLVRLPDIPQSLFSPKGFNQGNTEKPTVYFEFR